MRVLSIYIGGVGSIFWMWIITLICSSNTMVESILAIKHRKKKDNNSQLSFRYKDRAYCTEWR